MFSKIIVVICLLKLSFGTNIEIPFQTAEPGCEAVDCGNNHVCVETPKGPVCESAPCLCTKELEPVCCKMSNGRMKTTGNACFCNGCTDRSEIIYRGVCGLKSASCTDVAEICCKDTHGKVFKALNECVCRAGGGQVQAGTCDSW